MTTAATLHRVNYTPDLEVRSDGAGGRTIHGLAVPFDTPATIRESRFESFVESFKRGAFAKTIAERGDRVRLHVLHDQHTRLPIGRATTLREDAAGLYGEFRVSETQQGDDVLALVRDGALDGLSIGFRPVRDEWSRDRSTVTRIEAALTEISVVAVPAYDGARITGLRSLAVIDDGPYIPAATARERLDAILRKDYTK